MEIILGPQMQIINKNNGVWLGVGGMDGEKGWG